MYFDTYQELKWLAEVRPECLEPLTEEEFRQALREKKGEGVDGDFYSSSFGRKCSGA